jgi:hypothetical protein
MKIEIPKEVKNIAEFLEWLEPKETHTILAYTKRKGKYCFGFSLNKKTQKVEYLINDGVSVGKCKFENLNRYLYFVV